MLMQFHPEQPAKHFHRLNVKVFVCIQSILISSNLNFILLWLKIPSHWSRGVSIKLNCYHTSSDWFHILHFACIMIFINSPSIACRLNNYGSIYKSHLYESKHLPTWQNSRYSGTAAKVSPPHNTTTAIEYNPTDCAETSSGFFCVLLFGFGEIFSHKYLFEWNWRSVTFVQFNLNLVALDAEFQRHE